MFKKFYQKMWPAEDILVGYRETLGMLDLQGVEAYLKKQNPEKVYLVTHHKPEGSVAELFGKLPKVEIIVAEDMGKTLANLVEKLEGKKIKKVDLNDFGIRPIQRDCC